MTNVGARNTVATLSSVTNAMRILRLFTPKQTELGFMEIVRQMDIPKSSVHRLISTLENEGFLSKNPKTNHYRLGLSILALGGIIYRHRELYKEALPLVTKLTDTLGESAHICLLENQSVVYLFRVESNHPDRLLTQIGRKNPLHCTSEGLCILAFQPEEFIQQFLDRELHAYTPYTVTDRKQLLQILSEIREKDFCRLKSFFYEGYTSIAAPIRDHTGTVVSSLSVIGNSNRMTEENSPYFIDEIKEAASEISKHLGYYN